MSEERFRRPMEQRIADDEEAVCQLLETAGPRPTVPEADLAAIKQAFRAAWREQVPPPRRRRVPRGRVVALAALLLAGLGLAWWWAVVGPPTGGPRVTATVDRVGGQALIRTAGAELALSSASVGSRHELAPGAVISTEGDDGGGGRIALRLADGPSLRLDTGSRARVISASTLRLERGAVYVDSHPAAAGRERIAIETPLGVARDIGTQFEVRLLDGEAAARVRVREGEVRLDRGNETYALRAEQELTLEVGGHAQRSTIAVDDAAWSWTQAAAPRLVGEGDTVEAILTSVTREMGWSLRWADAQARSARSAVFDGSLDHLDVAQAGAVVLASVGLVSELVDGELVVRAAR